MVEVLSDCIGYGCLAVAAAGCVHALVAAALVRRPAASSPAPRESPGITVLKPLRGAEPALKENLASFLAQDYRGPVQILFSAEGETDAAASVVRELAAEWPGRDAALVLTGEAGGPNPKVSALVRLEHRIRHPVVVLADSDIAVPRDYLARLVEALEVPGVGLATCLYRGEGRNRFWARMSAMAIDYQFLPGVIVGLKFGLARPCFGATIALRRDTLASIGGFEAFVDRLADDYAIGEAVRALGFRVAVPGLVVAHTCAERGLHELLRHELRWARTIRAVAPAPYAASVVMHALPMALLGAAFEGLDALSVPLIAAALACRLVLALRVDHTLGLSSKRWLLGPLRDVLSFAVYIAAFFIGTVTWRGRRYRVHAGGTLTETGAPST